MIKPTVFAERERLPTSVYCEGILQHAPVSLEKKHLKDSNGTFLVVVDKAQLYPIPYLASGLNRNWDRKSVEYITIVLLLCWLRLLLGRLSPFRRHSNGWLLTYIASYLN